jgi:hypothetical protein
MATVAVEKLGSSSVHRRIVPAGRTISRALAVRVKVKRVRVKRRDTTTTERRELDFMTSPRSHAPEIRGTKCKATAEPAPIA